MEFCGIFFLIVCGAVAGADVLSCDCYDWLCDLGGVTQKPGLSDQTVFLSLLPLIFPRLIFAREKLADWRDYPQP